MMEVINYKCPILNNYYRSGHINSSPSVDVLVKIEDYMPYNPNGIICPMHETGSDCFIKISEYNDKRNKIIDGYKEGNGKYNEIKTILREAVNSGQSMDIKLNEEVERLKQQELQDVDLRKNTLCILVGGFKELK